MILTIRFTGERSGVGRALNFIILCGALLALQASASSQTSPTTLHVAPRGSGESCTRRAPCSIRTAQRRARAMNRRMTGDIRISLRGGTYTIDEPLRFTGDDSGFNNFRISYEAAAGAQPIISGGRKITGWRLFDRERDIYRAPIGALVTRQLYVNGVRAVRARTDEKLTGFTKTENGYRSEQFDMSKFANIRDVEIVGYNEWRAHRCPVASVSDKEITMRQPCWRYSQRDRWKMNAPTWIENALELLDREGEWYLDRAAQFIYYKPRAGERINRLEAIAPHLETLLEAEGTVENPLRNLTLKGITFRHATWLAPNQDHGYALLQAGHYVVGERDAYRATLANVRFNRVENVRVDNCTFEHLGGAALALDGGSRRNEIVGNVFRRTSSHAIHLGNVFAAAPADALLHNSHNLVANNLIHNIGEEYEDACAILAGYVSHTTIRNNMIRDVPYTGISVGWGWGRKSYMRENRILNNRVERYMLKLTDGGGIYTLSNQPDSTVEGNFVTTPATAVSGGHAGLYFDEGTGNYTARNNCFDLPDNMKRGWLNLAHNDTAHDLIIDRNFTTTAKQSTEKRDSKNVRITGTVVAPTQAWTAEARRIVERAGLEPGYDNISPPARRQVRARR